MANEIKVQNAILHILDNNLGMPVLSNQEVNLEEESAEFVESIVNKFLNDDNIKNANFINEDNAVKNLCVEFIRGGEFISFSKEIAGILFKIMLNSPDIKAADLICSVIVIDDVRYIGLFKLNYRTNYIHYVEYENEISINKLIKQKTVLPSENQKLEECILINMEDVSIKLIEKEYEINGAKEKYLSKIFLKCNDELSNTEKVKIITKTAQRLSKKYFENDFDNIARMSKAITENVDDTNCVSLENIAQEAFRNDVVIQQEYIGEIQKAGIKEKEIHLTEKITERKFRTQKIKTDTGIEINFPAVYYNNKEKIEFINNQDGSISIVIKNVNKISNK